MNCRQVRSLVVTVSVCALAFSFGVPDLKARAEQSRHHEAHEHGVAHLNVAVEGPDLYLELTSPAANIVAFEHSPRTDAQKARVKKAVDTLKDGEAMIVLPTGAQGSLADCTVDTNIDSEKTHDEAHENEGHSEFTAEYHFVCKHPEKLEHIDVKLIGAFPGIERIEVQLLTGKKQTALELTAKTSRISF